MFFCEDWPLTAAVRAGREKSAEGVGGARSRGQEEQALKTAAASSEAVRVSSGRRGGECSRGSQMVKPRSAPGGSADGFVRERRCGQSAAGEEGREEAGCRIERSVSVAAGPVSSIDPIS